MHDSAEDDGRDHHADEPYEEIAERFERIRTSRPGPTHRHAQEHGEENLQRQIAVQWPPAGCRDVCGDHFYAAASPRMRSASAKSASTDSGFGMSRCATA